MHYRQSLQLAYWLLFFDLLLGLVACILSGTGLLIADIAATVTYYVQCYINHVLGRPLPVICPPLPPQIPSTLNRPRRVTWADQVPRRAMAGVLAPDPETLDAPKVGVNCSEEERHGMIPTIKIIPSTPTPQRCDRRRVARDAAADPFEPPRAELGHGPYPGTQQVQQRRQQGEHQEQHQHSPPPCNLPTLTASKRNDISAALEKSLCSGAPIHPAMPPMRQPSNITTPSDPETALLISPPTAPGHMDPDPPWGANPYRLDPHEREEKQAKERTDAVIKGGFCNHHKTNGFLQVPPARQTREDRDRLDYEMYQERLVRENKAYVEENLRRMREMTERRRREGEAVAAGGGGGGGRVDVQRQGDVDRAGDGIEHEEEQTRLAEEESWRYTNW